ncbi:MAG TPA: methyltransferase domain-containing protein [Thermoanaerobaculia bacterium]|nr:methyltransferase domain-containing protein [Thermoanaerobaculia bacterium]
MSDVRPFYDGLADLYHLIYEDWPRSIENQARALDEIIRAEAPHARTVADVACGIGTQALGLAQRGYEVIGSDISEQALQRAEREAAARNLRIDFHIDDMLRLSTYRDRSVDVLLACDNAIPHLLSDEEIASAFRQFHRVIKPGGLCVISVRDYAAISREPLRLVPYGVRALPEANVAIFQVWEWEGDQYNLSMYFVQDDGVRVNTRVLRSRYYAISIAKLIDLFTKAGFADVRRIDDRYFQPLIIAR